MQNKDINAQENSDAQIIVEEKIVKVRVVDTEYKVPVIAKVAMVMAVVESMVLLAMFLK